MGLLNRDGILGAPGLAVRDVEVPEWGGTVRLQQLQAPDLETLVSVKGFPGVALAIALSVVDETGQRQFTAEDAEQIGQKQPQVLARLWSVVAELNAFDVGATEKN